MAELLKENEEFKKQLNQNDDTITELDLELRDVKLKLEEALSKIDVLKKEKEEECLSHDDWVVKTYRNMSCDGKREFRDAFTAAQPSMKRGTISRLRKSTKMNFSMLTAKEEDLESEVKKKIVAFAMENTIEVPDKKKYMVGARFRTTSLLSLYSTFEMQHPNQCTYKTFARYWPMEFIKPKPSEFGTCLCVICQNMELKIEAMVTRKFLGKDQLGFGLETVIMESRNGHFEAENEFKAELESIAQVETDVGYLEWTKVKQTELSKNTGRAKSDKTQRLPKHLPAGELSKIILKDFEEYKEHLERDYVMKKEIKKVRLQALDNEELAVLHIDWAEQHSVTEIKEVQSAYFNGRFSYDLHTGYCYTKDDSHGFVSLSDSSDHKAEAVNCAIRPKIEKLVAAGKKTFVICSDSPTAQYRNSKNIMLMKKLCQEFKISIRLLFTEAGHGKSPCDGVGGNVKTQFEMIALDIHGNKEVLAIRNAEDVARLLKERTNLSYDITVHHQHDTDKIKNSLGKLSPLVGALKVHEVFIGDDLVIKKKNLPSDPFYKAVLIKESKRRLSAPAYNDDMESDVE